ncbi:hypothetical protein NC651_028215 [Populus alba x Populus x berolinensis]|nr:hypothetical protein NC651_028215 [Populus alba x Populus x berolinensis]
MSARCRLKEKKETAGRRQQEAGSKKKKASGKKTGDGNTATGSGQARAAGNRKRAQRKKGNRKKTATGSGLKEKYSASGGNSLAVKGGAGLLFLLLAILVYILMRGRCSCTTECNGGADSSQASGGTPRAMHFIAGE